VGIISGFLPPSPSTTPLTNLFFSVTCGVVSRVDVRPYVGRYCPLLSVQIDAAINAGALLPILLNVISFCNQATLEGQYSKEIKWYANRNLYHLHRTLASSLSLPSTSSLCR